MNTYLKRNLLALLTLLLSACVHYPHRYAYYPNNGGYDRSYAVVERNYYGGLPRSHGQYRERYEQRNRYDERGHQGGHRQGYDRHDQSRYGGGRGHHRDWDR